MPEKKDKRVPKAKIKRPKKAAAKPKKTAAESAALPNPNQSRAMLIVNPVAGTGSALKIWDDLQETLRDLGVDFDYRFTERHGHAIEIAAESAKKGYGTVVVVGGDGTIFEVTNGIMSLPKKDRPAVGIVPTGRGSDFCRTLDIPQDWFAAAPLLVSGKRRTIDVGKMEYVGPDGTRAGYFANVAGLGFDGEVTERANNMPEGLSKTVGGTGTYLLSLLITYARYREKDVMLSIDDRQYRVLATTVVIANCRYFGGRMHIAPDAVPDDGLFDVVVIGAGFGPPVLELPEDKPPPSHTRLERSLAKVRMARNVPKVYKGSHVRDESVMVARGSRVKVASDDRMVLQADGEVIGAGPFSAEIIPGALEIIA